MPQVKQTHAARAEQLVAALVQRSPRTLQDLARALDCSTELTRYHAKRIDGVVIERRKDGEGAGARTRAFVSLTPEARRAHVAQAAA